MSDLHVFLAERPRLQALAYRMLGSHSEAEDALQELWLRWQALRSQPDNNQAYLTRMLGNLCLDQLRTRRKQVYPGPWLPEPELDDSTSEAPDALHGRWQTLSLAFLLVLEQLTPLQRVVWVLRELFGYRYAELGPLVERSPAACRKLFERAQQRLIERSSERQNDAERELAQRCLAACLSGDTEKLLGLLSTDAELLSDGGGVVSAALRPIYGTDRILRFLHGLRQKYTSSYRACVVQCNGMPALALLHGDTLDGLLTCEVRTGHVVRLMLLRNPHKLDGLRQAMQKVSQHPRQTLPTATLRHLLNRENRGT